MYMPDGVRALLEIALADRQVLTRAIYNIAAFSPRADEIAASVQTEIPAARFTFNPDPARQRILDSWPKSLDDSAARRDWGWAPDYVDAMVRAARADQPGDYVVATGRAHSVREFVAAAFAAAGIDDWEPLVRQDERFFRPADPTELVGDAAKARDVLGWAPTVGFEEIVARMVAADLPRTAG